MQALDRKKSRNLLIVLVDVFQQDPVRPHTQPAVNTAGACGSLVGVEFLQGFLDALQPIFGLLGHRAAQVQNPAAANGCGLRHLGGPLKPR